MASNDPSASIILLTCNGEQYLSEVLSSIFAQKTHFCFEVIVIDSGGKEKTLDILKGFPVRIHQIPNSEFGHGRTRNLGARLASGRYLVFLTQDATPANEHWLENLIKAVADDENVAGAYSRQLPRPDCNPCEWRDIEGGAPAVSIVKRVDFEDELQRKSYEKHWELFIRFSDVSSCIKREALEKLPFNEELDMVEDQEWCKRAIEAGYTVIYEATSAVYHSHNFPLKRIYRRHFAYGRSFREFVDFAMGFVGVLRSTLLKTALDFFFIVGRAESRLWKLKWIVRSPFVRFSMEYGLYKGLQGSR